MILARRRKPRPRGHQAARSDQPSLPAADLAAADQAVKNWRAKPAIAEANEVPEQDSWRAEGEAPNKALVARAEGLLDKLGYDIGAADGEAGARTREAIKAFELRNGMDEAGEVTVPLVTKLERLAG